MQEHKEVTMIIEPKVRNYICTTAHPEGCRESVYRQMQYVKGKPARNTKQRTLIIGSSTGYGLSSRICAAWSDQAPTIGVCFEKPSMKGRTATAGWYNTAAFEEFANKDGLYAKTINGDAYSAKTKEEVMDLIRRDLGQIDLVVYSLAAPRRTMPDGTVYTSVLKTTGEPFTSKSLDLRKNVLTEETVLPATEAETEATVRVMGGDDWKDWMNVLKKEQLLSKDIRTVAYSYIGPEMTYPIYTEGTIGRAKEHLYQTALQLNAEGMPAYVSVNKAVVTQSSSAIPAVPLYISVLYRIMKEEGIHEGTVEQMYRLWNQHLLESSPVTDIPNRIRLDDQEMRPDIQKKVMECWNQLTNENLEQLADIEGYWQDFYQLFGFKYDNIDYTADVPVEKSILSIAE